MLPGEKNSGVCLVFFLGGLMNRPAVVQSSDHLGHRENLKVLKKQAFWRFG